MNPNKITFSIITLSSLYYFILLISSFYPALANKLIKNNMSYGDLFQMSKITDFKIPLPQIQPLSQSDSISDSDIIIMGDSFFNIAAGYSDFSSQIKNSLGLKIHNYNIQGSGEPWRQTNPLDYLKANPYSPKKPKILILESVDRGISMRYSNINKDPPSPKISAPLVPLKKKEIVDKQGPIGSIDSVEYENFQLSVKGWAADFETGSPISQIQITLDGQTIGQANLNLLRADVSAHFSQSQWDFSGWSFKLPLKPKYGQHQVSAIFLDSAGNQSQPNNPKTFYLPPFYDLSNTFSSTIKTINTKIKQQIKKIDYLLTENFFNSSLTELIATLNFRIFKQISPLTPKYSLNPKLLFYQAEVNFYQNSPSPAQIQTIADNYQYLSNQLKAQYNIDLLVIPMPTKYTIYHHLAGDQTASNFLPDLYLELTKRKINFVDLYHLFMQSPGLLYLQSDTHWNKTGINLGVNETLRVLTLLHRPK